MHILLTFFQFSSIIIQHVYFAYHFTEILFMIKIFIDGSNGTTGLRLRSRLQNRDDITLITLPDAVRKDPEARKEAIASADVSFLCLPDPAAVESVSLAGKDSVIIDTSTAHRTLEDWTYGFPELKGQREKIQKSSRIANPGCHASGFIALVAPLIKEGLLSPDALLTCFSVTGYSGGGAKMISQYEASYRDKELDSPRQYALGQSHKHLPEMVKLCGLKNAPIFSPIVADFYSGMAVTVPVFASQLQAGPERIREVYGDWYHGPLISLTKPEDAMLAANALSGKDTMQVSVLGNGDRILLTAVFDNLGKGASGAAIQNMNIRLGLEETTGLVL